jgi:ribonuclease HII
MSLVEQIREYPVDYIIGIDEVGTGAWAGPFVVAACACRQGWRHDRVRDSKQFDDVTGCTAHEQRVSVVQEVLVHEVEEYWIKSIAPEEFSEPGTMGKAITRAMGWLVDAATTHYPSSMVVIDGADKQGLHKFLHGDACLTYLTQADEKVPAVAAASIFAKTYRDELMIQASKLYIHYGFRKNKGYGTPKHIAGLERYGACPIHRMGCSGVQKHASTGSMKRSGNHRRKKRQARRAQDSSGRVRRQADRAAQKTGS